MKRHELFVREGGVTKRAFLAIMLLLLLVNTLALAFDISFVKAWTGGKVIIMSDGSINPSTAPIQRNGSIYTLTDDIFCDSGIVIERDNIILDGAGYTLQGIGNATWTGIWFSERNNITIKNMKISGFYWGIYAHQCSHISISENCITSSETSIQFYSTSNSHISGNNITGNSYNGIVLYSSSHNSIIGNNIKESNEVGIRISYCRHNRISGNNITNNWIGINIFSSSYLSMVGNSIKENYANGIELYDSSSENAICGNDIRNNYCGISVSSSSNNVIYHNNFANNVQQVYTETSTNVWDDDYPSGGNYWSDYPGTDSNSDGIGDTPYTLGAGNVDRYPHMHAFEGSTLYLYPSTSITQAGITFNISIIASHVKNLWAWQVGLQWDPTILQYISYTWGDFQTFARASKLSPSTVDHTTGKTSKPALESALRGWLAPVSTAEVKLMTITFKPIKSGTSSLRLINVSLKSQNLTSTTAYPRWSDVNADGIIDTEDVDSTYKCWENGYYNQTTDFNNDGIVDITDITIVSSDFGKNNTDPQWGFTNTIYDTPVIIINAKTQAQPSQAYIPVPHHSQIKSYYCGPAALEMLFDFYGPEISQTEIADVARTSPSGTYTCDMVRAAHFSNISTSLGKESALNFTGYTPRKLGYATFECGGMTIDDLKSLILAGYPIIVLTTWHFRVVVGYGSTYIIFQDSLYGSDYTMTYSNFDADWDYSGHWGLFVSPWKVEVSNVRNVLLGDVFNVTATITYPWAPPFQKYQYPASFANATIKLPEGLALVPGETSTKVIGTGYLIGGDSAEVTWTVQAQSLGGYVISVEAEGKVIGYVPPIPYYDFGYEYEDRIGGSSQSIVAVTSSLDNSPPTTIHDYDELWYNQDFRINLTATDDVGNVLETYYRINNGPVKTLSQDGQPSITTSSANNTLEYWSVDWAGNEEFPHKFLSEIKLDKVKPNIAVPTRIPSGDVATTQEVRVKVNVTDPLAGVKNVTLFYTVTDGTVWENRTMDYNVSTSLYEALIPTQQDGTLVKFKIVAYDNVGNMAVKDNNKKYYTYRVQAVYELKIITTTGGTTIPAPGTYSYFSGSLVFVAAIQDSKYIFDHWELDGVDIGSYNISSVVMNRNHTLKAVFSRILPFPVGGYSFSFQVSTRTETVVAYVASMTLLTLIFTKIKQKTKGKH